MPSPFPGMDPYLEGSLWPTLHFTLAAEIVRQIAPRLRPKYVALPVERCALEITRGTDRSSAGIYPDVGVAQATDRDMAQPQSIGTAPTTTAAPAATPLRLATVIPERVPRPANRAGPAACRR